VCWSLGWRLGRVDPATPQVSRSRPDSLQGDLRR